MFNATLNRLPPPPPFVSDHQPLRLTADAQRPLPSGECRFILPHPQNIKCPCQTFTHNRSIPGSTCDCGHQACYHASAQEDVIQATAAAAFESRIRQLETELRLERQMRERDVRTLRETLLQPLYQHLEATRLKISGLEDRVESNYDDQVRLRDRIVALDDNGMLLEKRLDDIEIVAAAAADNDEAEENPVTNNHTLTLVAKRRRVNINNHRGGLGRQTSSQKESEDDDLSMSQHSSSHRTGPITNFAASRSMSPAGQQITGHGTLEYGAMAAPPERDGPRSSGILNLVQLSGRTPSSYHYNHRHDSNNGNNNMPLSSSEILPPRTGVGRGEEVSPPPSRAEPEEARSSGFLALDLAEKLARRGRGVVAVGGAGGTGGGGHPGSSGGSGGMFRGANMSAPPGTLASPELSSGDDRLNGGNKRKRDVGTGVGGGVGLGGKTGGDLDALDMLANVSAVSAMAR